MKKKLFIFLVSLSFVITTFSCSVEAIEPPRPDFIVPMELFILVGLYQTLDFRWTLSFTGDGNFRQRIISPGHDDVITGTYSLDSLNHLVLQSSAGDAMLSFNIERHQNGQIDRLIDESIGNTIFNSVNTNPELLVGPYRINTDDDSHGIFLLDTGQFVMRTSDGNEIIGSYYINPFGVLIFENDNNPVYRFRIERDPSGRAVRLIVVGEGTIFNRVRIIRHDEH